MSNTETLRSAAQAVLDRWDSPQWEWIKHGPTADLMHALRTALAQPAASGEPVAEVLIDSCADHESRIEAMDYLPAGTMLYRAAQPAPALVPPGWVLVPAEATEAMCKAAVIYANGNAVYRNVVAEALKIEEAIYGEAYAAMLAAAPDAQKVAP